MVSGFIQGGKVKSDADRRLFGRMKGNHGTEKCELVQERRGTGEGGGRPARCSFGYRRVADCCDQVVSNHFLQLFSHLSEILMRFMMSLRYYSKGSDARVEALWNVLADWAAVLVDNGVRLLFYRSLMKSDWH